ncbi:SLAP domain-containing protein [Companilactobacillus metriopterae]|uniref:SLAP domain-containing protein n=1 Tax=Companilactobacillus metriopterae TaxID=1909267 RepID=UPI00100B57DB|nr:SLAP domain-containing protein [Companilactobacillus metriopterae]
MNKRVNLILTTFVLMLGLITNFSVTKADNLVQSIDTSSIAKYNDNGDIISSNILNVKNDTSIYKIISGEFVKTTESIKSGSSWLVGVNVLTDDNHTYYQISTNQYVIASPDVSYVFSLGISSL